MSIPEAAILLKDIQGERSLGTIRGLFKSPDKPVYQGELLLLLPRVKVGLRKDGKPPHNYQLASDPGVTLFCTEDDVAPISDHEYHLLTGIKLRDVRYKVFQKDLLDWGSKLKEGAFVYVALPSKNPVSGQHAVSVIKYIGPLPNEYGIQFGVEIQEEQYRHQGSSNGFFGGEQYFQCDENCALFVSLDQLTPLEPIQQDPPQPELPPTADPQRQHPMMTRSQSKAQQSVHVDPPKQPHPRFKMNDRVVVYNKRGVGVHGTVRWIEQVIGADAFIAVGIETDVIVPSKDFTGSLTQFSDRFKCTNSSHGKIVMRESEVISETVDATQRHEQRKKSSIQGSSIDQDEDMGGGGNPTKAEETNATAIKHTSLSPVDPKTRSLTRNIAEMLDLAENYEKSMEELNLKIQLMNDEIIHLKDELQHASIRAEQQTSDIDAKTRENSILEEKLEKKLLEIVELEVESELKLRHCQKKHEQNLKEQAQRNEANFSQRLKVQRDLHQEIELELQQELQEVRQQCTQFQEQLSEVIDEKEQLKESVQQQLKEQQDQHQEIETLLQHELRELRQQCTQFQQQVREVVHEKEQLQARLQQQLREQQDQHQQVEMRLQQEVREARQQLREAADERQQFQARVETAFAFIRGDPLTTQVGFDAIELWEVPREDVHISNKILGTGGWGYVAEGTFHGQKVAVKCLHRGILSQFTTNHVRREISIMAQVRHPNLVLLIGAVLNADTGPLIITELLDRTLRSAYEDHALEERCKLPILRDVASALNYLHTHRRPIVHRDVSSSNILLLALHDGNWLVKLSDFGSANLIRTATTPAEGAAIYSAPEVITDQRSPQTTKVDVYSFGVLVCEVTLCQLPPDPRDFPAYLDTLERDTDIRIHQLAKNCTKRNPDDRLTMQEVLEQIDQFLQ